MTTTDLALDAMAAYRITKLITDDEITAPIRDRIIQRAYGARLVRLDEFTLPTGRFDWTALAIDDPDPPKLATLLTCRWCMGVHIGFGVVVARRLFPRWWPDVARALAYATAAALLANLED